MRRRAFTLLEMMLVVGLIALTLGVIGIQAPRALQGERFERGVDQVKSRIALAQELMLNYQTDVTLSFKEDKDGLLCTIQTAKPIAKKLRDEINRRALIKGIKRCSERALNFDGSIGVTPRGRLVLEGKNQEATLTLKGFPSQAKRGEHALQESEAIYPEAVLFFI